MRASTSVIINRPVREVWDFIADLGNMDKWVSGVSDQQQTLMTNDLAAGSDSWATCVIFALFGLLIRPMTRRQLHKELIALKALQEGQ